MIYLKGLDLPYRMFQDLARQKAITRANFKNISITSCYRINNRRGDCPVTQKILPVLFL